jgi:hypothetical protein
MIFMKYYNHNEMKKGVLALVSLFFFSAAVLPGQNPNRERLESYKIAFFTQRLKLTPGEAEKFWPLYNDLQEKRAGIQAERQTLNRRSNQEAESLSDKELTAMGDKLIELEVLETELSVKFHQHLKAALPPMKVIRFYQAENQYKVLLLNQLQERRVERLDPGQR